MASKPLLLAMLSVLVVASLGLWGLSVDPEHYRRWTFIVIFLPVFWGAIELLQGGRGRREEIMNWHRSVVAAVGFLMAVKAGSQLAIANGLLDAASAPAARRFSGVLFGLFLTIWGNYLPKIISPWRAEEEWFDWQRVHRFVGWLASLSGIALVIVWLAFPVEAAKPVALGITAIFCVLGAGRKFISIAAYSRRQPPAPKEETW